mmetsp:Transcript_16107/g.54735  ORF Transcript_16107/g.54735 Transcript_16107/m.54735 type:complete len:218 (-) Transcript_16107:442-1095(-)
MTWTSGRMPWAAQNWSISFVSTVPPTRLPLSARRRGRRSKAPTEKGSGTPPIMKSVEECLRSGSMGVMGCEAATVSRMVSNVAWASRYSTAKGLVLSRCVAPRASMAALRRSPRESTVTLLPMASASFTPMCPRPPKPTTATCLPPASMPARLRGANMVMPAHSRGPATSMGMESGSGKANLALTVMQLESPPWVMGQGSPSVLDGVLYVCVAPRSQ